MRFQKTGYHGLYFPDLGISLDGYHPKAELTFVSHAHADHIPRNKKTIAFATEPTLDLMKLRGFNGLCKALLFGETFDAPKCSIKLYPAGHILGSAMILIQSEDGDLLYTGDYRTPPSSATEGFEAPDHVDFLITEATFGLPIYKWRKNEDIAEEIRDFAMESLNDGYTPLFLAYNLGKAQEIMVMLSSLNHPVMIHGAGFKLCSVYEKYGFDLGQYSAYDRNSCNGKILIAPSSALNKGFASNLKKLRVAYCSGWAANEARRTQLNADRLIPISDHLDFFELIRFCKQLNPEMVYITHTPNPDVVQHTLEKEGISSSFLDLEAETED